MDFFTKQQQLISQLQGVTPENFNYWEESVSSFV